MPHSYGRFLAVAVFVLLLTFSPVAHAAEVTSGINDPFTDVIQLWSGVLSTLGSFAHRVEVALAPYQAPIQFVTTSQPAAVAQAVKTPSAVASTPAVTPTPAAIPTPTPVVTHPTTQPTSVITQLNPNLTPLLAPLSNLIALIPAALNENSSKNFQPQIDALQREISLTNAVAPTTGSSGGGGITNLSGFDTGDLAEGSNLYFTPDRVNQILEATTSLPNLTTLGTLTSLSLATNCSSFGNGGKLTTDGFGNVVCAADQGGSGSTVGGADTQIQFNNNGSFTGSSGLTFSSSTAKLTVTNASTSNLTAGYASTSNLVVSNGFTFGNASGILKSVAGIVSSGLANLTSDVTGILPVANGGTGSTTLSGILVGNNTSGIQTATFSGPLSLSGNTLSISQANGTTNGFLASTDWTNFNNKVSSTSLSAVYPLAYNPTSGVFTLGFGTTTANIYSQTQTFSAGASTTNFTISNASNGFLQTNASGLVSATSTFSTANLFGTLGIGNGGIGTSAVPTFGQLLVGNGTGGYNLVSTSSLGIVSGGGSVSSITAGTGLTGGTITTTGTIALDLTHANSWTGLQTFANASSTLQTNSALWLPNITTNSLLKTNSNGQVAAAIAGTDYQAPITASYPILFSANNLSLAFGTTTANAWSQLQTFTSGFIANASSTIGNGTQISGLTISGGATTTGSLAITGTTGTTSIAAGQGFTIGASQLVLQQTSGNFGIGTANPNRLLNVVGGSSAATNILMELRSNFASANTGTALLFTNSTTAGSANGQGELTVTRQADSSGVFSVALANSSPTLLTDLTILGASGNVGIGTTSPFAKLSLVGSAGSASSLFFVSSSTAAFATTSVFAIDQNGNTTIGNNGSVLTINGATTTAANGFNILTGCFSVAGTCLSTGSGISLSAANTWTGLQTFNNSSSSLATITNLWTPNVANTILSTDANGKVQNTTISYPLQFSSNNLSLAFGTTTANTWSQLQTFTNGFISNASTTIGNGTAISGLTINGGSTTTLNAYFAGNVGIGTSTPWAKLSIAGNDISAASEAFAIADSNGNNLFNVNDSGQANLPDTTTGQGLFFNNTATTSTAAIQSLDLGGFSFTFFATNRYFNGSDWAALNNRAGSSFQIQNDNFNFYSWGAGLAGASNAVARFTVASGGNVGIGSTTPGSLLSIGTTTGINFSTGTSTFSSTGGINLASGCFAIGGTCLPTNASQLTNTYTVNSGSANINAGDIVSYINGQVQKATSVYSSATTSVFGTPISANAVANSTFESAAELSSTSFVLAYQSGSGGDAFAVIGTVSGTSITYGTPTALNAVASQYVSVAALDSTHFVVAYEGASNFANAIVSTVSGTTITPGAVKVLNAATSNYTSVAALDSTHFVVSYQNGSTTFANAVVSSVSGTTITTGIVKVLNAVASVTPSVAALSSTSFVVAYSGTSSFTNAVVSNISGTSTIAAGIPVALNSSNSSYTDVAALDSTHFVVAYENNSASQFAYAVASTVSGTSTIAAGTPVAINAVSSSYVSVAALSSTSFVVASDILSGYGNATVSTVSGTVITAGTFVPFSQGVNAPYDSVIALSSTSFVVGYEGGNTYATAVVGTYGSVATAPSALIASTGTPAAANAVVSSFESAAELSSTSFVLAYMGASNYAYAVVGTVSGNSISYGTPVALNAVTSFYVSVAALSSTSFVVAYDNNSTGFANAVVSTVSGTAITAGTPAVLNNSPSSVYESVTALSSTSFVVAYEGTSNFVYAVAGTVSGTTITTYTPVALNAALSGYVSVTALSSTSFVVAYQNGNTTFADAVVGTLSGNSVSPGTPVELNAVYSQYESVAALSSTSFVVAYATGGGTTPSAVVSTVSGSTITAGNPAVFSALSSSYESVTAVSPTAFVESYIGPSSHPYAIAVTVSGSSIFPGTPVALDTNTAAYSSVAALGSTGFVVAYSGASNFASAAAGTLITQNSNFLGMAINSASANGSVTVASNGVVTGLSGLVAGSTYYWSASSGLTTVPTSYKIGIALSSSSILLNSSNGAGTDQFFGDAVFANDFRITEAPGNPQGLIFENQLGKQVASLDENGNWAIQGMLSASNVNANTFNLSGTTTVAELTTATSSTNSEQASSSESATPPEWAGVFANASDALKGALQAFSDSVVQVFGRVIYATSGIFEHIVSKTVQTDQLCVGSTCVTPAQFQAMVAASASATATSTPPTDDATNTPPIIQITGSNPATITIGSTYNDLGATITGPQADLNLDINTFVNGTPMNPVQIDTTQAATDTIDYVVTDQNGLISTSTRTVIIQAAPESIPTDDASTSTSTTP